MAPHSKALFVPLFSLVHLRIALLFCVFCGAGGIDDRDINNGTALHHLTGLNHDTVDRLKEQPVQVVGLQKMPELTKRCFIRHGLCQKVYTSKLLHGVAIVNRVFCYGIRWGKPDLDQAHSQHLFNSHG